MPSGPMYYNFVALCLISLKLIVPNPIRVEFTSITGHWEGCSSMVIVGTSAPE